MAKYFVRYKVIYAEVEYEPTSTGVDVDTDGMDAQNIIDYLEAELDNERNYGETIEILNISKL
jgi:hypothetical protein